MTTFRDLLRYYPRRYLDRSTVTPIRQITEVNSDIQKGIAAAESIFEILDATPERDGGTVELESVIGRVEFKDINFRYNDNVFTAAKTITAVRRFKCAIVIFLSLHASMIRFKENNK